MSKIVLAIGNSENPARLSGQLKNNNNNNKVRLKSTTDSDDAVQAVLGTTAI